MQPPYASPKYSTVRLRSGGSIAVDELERAVNLTGDDPTITEHLGDAYRKVGKLRDARHQYEDAMAKAQDTDQVARLKAKISGLSVTEQHAAH